jgi:hypothetical protein
MPRRAQPLNLEWGGCDARIRAGCKRFLTMIKQYKTVEDENAMLEDLFQQVLLQHNLQGEQWNASTKEHEPVCDKHRRYNMYRYLSAAAGIVRPTLPPTHPLPFGDGLGAGVGAYGSRTSIPFTPVPTMRGPLTAGYSASMPVPSDRHGFKPALHP